MTSATPDDDARRADDEAVEWVILLRDEPDNDEVRIRFEAWLAASPINAKAWAKTAHAYDRAGDARPAFARPVRVAEERPLLPPGPAPYGRRRGKSRPASKQFMARRAWVTVSVAACLALIFAPSLTLRARADYLTGTAETTEAKLPDGTLARLAPASAIAVTYAGNRREVRLLKGEAWFDVRHDPSRPFYVDANGVTTTDIGTAFDVHLDPKGVTTEVAQGRVRIAYGGAPPISELLSGGDSVRVAFNGAISRTTRPADQVAAWRNRQIIVRDRPASDVIDALRPWFAGIIVVRGLGFSDHRVTGVYNTADPVEALRGLMQAYGGSVTTVTPWVILLSAGPTSSAGAPK